jgi:hypothetical protein
MADTMPYKTFRRLVRRSAMRGMTVRETARYIKAGYIPDHSVSRICDLVEQELIYLDRVK